MKPYNENREGNIIKRVFDTNVDKSELTWHQDHEDRIVLPINENDWMLQFDNELPIRLKTNEEYFIPKNTFHRLIKGSNTLMVEIIETNFEDDEYELLEEGKKKKKKKDACYYKVRSRYDVWPSAYASGALVKCRKVGAKNWGNKSDESLEDEIETIGESIENLEIYEAKKTDFSKEKSKGLHGWFERQGGKGKSKGWVDCNTCRKDPKTGKKKCKTCGRKEGEERAKYPACRPTPASCGTSGKGKSWGKKSNNENLNLSEEFSIFDKNYLTMKLYETFGHDDAEPMIEPQVAPKPKVEPKPNEVNPNISPSRRNKPFLPIRETQPDPKAVTEGKFDYEVYHKSLASCFDEAEEYVIKRGYDPISFELSDPQHVSYGQTQRYNKELTLNGKPQRKMFHMQVYRMDSGNYELNMYFN